MSFCDVQRRVKSSVVDSNTLNLDPDPGFWSYLDPDPDPGLYNQFWKKKSLNNFKEKYFSMKKVNFF